MSNPLALPSIGTLFSSVWKEYTNRFQLLFIISLIANIVGLVLQIAMIPLNGGAPSGPWHLAGIFVGVIVTIYLTIWGQAALTLALRSTEKTGWEKFFALSQKKIIPVLLAGILIGLATLGGLILLIIPGIIFAIWFNFTYFFVIFEDKGIIDSMKASKALVKGNVFAIFVRLLAVVLVFIVISIVVGFFTRQDPLASTITGGLITMLIMPFMSLYNYRLYTALKQPAAPAAVTSV